MENNNIGVAQATPQTLNITTLNDLQRYASGNTIELPEFSEGQPFVARLRRPSMLSLVKSGKIPNSLLVSANDIFQSGVGNYDAQDESSLKNMFDILDIICEAALVEPTYQQIKEAGLELSDNQLITIFSYTQQGVQALEKFR